MPGRNLTINANFAINSYTLTYFLDEKGEVYREKSFKFGETVTLNPNAPQKTGHTFSGWDKETPTTMPANDVSITAQWTKNKYLLTLYLTDSTDYYTEKFAEIEVEYDTVLNDALTVETPVAPYGYRFAGWNFGEFSTMPAHNMDANAIWEAITVNLTLHYGNDTSEYTVQCGKSLKPYLDDVALDTENYLFDGTWQYENGYTVSEDAVAATSDLILTANSSKRVAVYVYAPTDHPIRANASMYLYSSNFEDFNNTVLSKICGTVQLRFTLTNLQCLGTFVTISSNGTQYLSKTCNSNLNSFSIEVPYQSLKSGLLINWTAISSSSAPFSLSDIQIEAVANDNYCVEMVLSGSNNTPTYQLFTFNSLDEVNTITYTVPTKASTTRTFTTEPITVTGSVYYAFDGWKANGTAVNIVNNKLQLKSLLKNTRLITLNGSFSESHYGDYTPSVTMSHSFDSISVNRSGLFDRALDMTSIKNLMSKYSLTLTKIDISMHIKETDDAYQEVYLSTMRCEMKNGANYFNGVKGGADIYGHGSIETVPGKKGEGDFNASVSVNYSAAALPDTIYLTLGAWGGSALKNSAWTASNIKITYHFA